MPLDGDPFSMFLWERGGGGPFEYVFLGEWRRGTLLVCFFGSGEEGDPFSMFFWERGGGGPF